MSGVRLFDDNVLSSKSRTFSLNLSGIFCGFSGKDVVLAKKSCAFDVTFSGGCYLYCEEG